MIRRFNSRPILRFHRVDAVFPAILVLCAILCLAPLLGRAPYTHVVNLGSDGAVAVASSSGADQDVAMPDSARAFQVVAPSSLTVSLIVIQVLVWRRLVSRERAPGSRDRLIQPPYGRYSRPVLSAFRN